MVNPGRLRERVEVLEGTIENTVGGAVTHWDTLGKRWAAVAQVDAKGAAKYAMTGTTDVTHEVILRGDADLRVTLGGTLFRWRNRALQPALPPETADHRGRYIKIACKEVSDGGAGSS